MKPIERAREFIRLHDGGTHFDPNELMGLLREIVDEQTPILDGLAPHEEGVTRMWPS